MGCIKMDCNDSSYPTDSGGAAQLLIKWTRAVMGRPDSTCRASDSFAAERADESADRDVSFIFEVKWLCS
jgi:hypothetical protein